MPRFRKDVLKAGKYSVLTPDGKGRRMVEYTPAHLKQMHDNAVAQRAVSEVLSPPFCAEHQDKTTPRPKAELLADKVNLHLGFGDGVELSPDGSTLSYFIEAYDEETAKKGAAVKYVSPEIQHDWQDGSGRVWPGMTITHIAATAKPVQFDQQPLQRLSTVRLSLADRLGDNTVPDIDDILKNDKDGDGKDDATEDKGIGKPPEAGGVGEYSIQDAMQGLQALGLHLPPGTTPENMVQHICVACHALANAKPETPTEETPPGPTEQPRPAPGAPVMMSLEKRLEVAQSEVARLGREDVVRRIKSLRLTGRINKPHQDRLLAEAQTVRLSLSPETGKLGTVSLIEKIAAYEELEQGSATPIQLSQEKPTPVPDPEEEGSKPDAHVMHRLTGGAYVPRNGKG